MACADITLRLLLLSGRATFTAVRANSLFRRIKSPWRLEGLGDGYPEGRMVGSFVLAVWAVTRCRVQRQER